MMNIEIYSKDWCPYCDRAKTLLTDRGLEYTEIDVTNDAEREAEMRARSQRRSVPQIFVDGDHVGGFDDLATLDAQDGLKAIAEDGVLEPQAVTSAAAGAIAALDAEHFLNEQSQLKAA